ncbi:hypothetical protein KAJ27_18200 [bacterium]|nr:hypothetical protein [bacterium]
MKKNLIFLLVYMMVAGICSVNLYSVEELTSSEIEDREIMREEREDKRENKKRKPKIKSRKKKTKKIIKKKKKSKYSVLKKWNAALMGTSYRPSGIYWDNSEVGTTDHPFESMTGGVTYYKGLLGYTFYNGWRFELDAGKWREKGSKTVWDKNIDIAGKYFFGDEITNYDAMGVDHVDMNYYIRPIELSISYIRNHASNRLKTFTGIGIGSYKNDLHYYYRTPTDTLISIHKKQSVPVYVIQGGLDYFLTKNLALRFKAKYLWGGLDVFVGPQDFIINEVLTGTNITVDEKQEIVDRFNDAEERSNLDSFQIELGMSMFFDLFSSP